MVRRMGDVEPEPNSADRDEQLGEAIEAYLALAEAGQAPDPATFAAGYPGLEEDVIAALEGLALVKGLVGDPHGPGHRLESGRRVAGYRIVRELGRGGMGIVYEAVHVGLDRPVALKVLGSSAAPDSSGRRRFLNEARTAAGLHHTHIVPVFDVGQVGGLCYYAMQRIEGSGLDRVIKHLRRDRSVAAGSTFPGRSSSRPNATPPAPVEREMNLSGLLGDSTATWGGRVPKGLSRELIDEPTPFVPPRGSAYYRWVATVGKQAAEALAHAHAGGVIHRDVKPSNLLVDARGMIWMADFGLARRLADPSQTQVDSLLGTPRYMSPEQANTGAIDGRSDIYSLGATLYELLTFRPPFEGKTAAELINQIASRDPATIRSFDKRVPRDLETIVLKSLNKRVQDRYPTAAEFADDLERFLNHEPVRARRIGPLGRAWRAARRNRLLTTVSAIAIVAIAVSVSVSYANILYERNEAVKARGEAQKSADQLKVAIGDARSALLAQLVQNAQVVRMSAVVDRRSTGLDLLKRAAELPIGPQQRMWLRDEAAAFMTIRDVERRPEIALSDPAQSFVFAQDGQHMVTLSEDGSTLRFWDVEKRSQISVQELIVDLPRSTDFMTRDRQFNRGRQRFMGGRPQVRMVAAGDDIALIDSDNKGIRLYNAATGAVSGNLRLFDPSVTVGPPEPEREIMSIAFSADGMRFLTVDRVVSDPMRFGGGMMGMGGFGPVGGGFDPRPRDTRVHLWNALKPNRPIATVYDARIDARDETMIRGPWASPLSAISPDGKTVAVAGANDAEISIWTRDGSVRTSIDWQAELTALALGPQGFLAAAGNRSVHLWDLNHIADTRGSLPAINPGLGVVDQLRFSPEDPSLLALSGRNSGVELWDISASAKVASLPLNKDWQGMAVGPRNRLIAVGQGSSLAFWEVVNPQVCTEISGFPTLLKSLAFSSGGDLAMVDFMGNLRIWSQGECPAKSHINERLSALSLAWDSKGRLISQLVARPETPGQPLAARPDSASQQGDRIDWLEFPSLKADTSVRLPEVNAMNGPRGGNGFRATAPRIAQAQNGQLLLMSRFNELFVARPRPEGGAMRVTRLEIRDTNESSRFDGPLASPDRRERGNPAGPPPDRSPGANGGGGGGRNRGGDRLIFWRDVAINPAGNRVYLLASSGEEFTAWSLKGNRLERLGWAIAGRFSCMALSHDGTTLALGDRQGGSGTVLLVDAETGAIKQRLFPSDPEKPASITAIAFSPDHVHLAVASVGLINLWKLDGPRAEVFVHLPSHSGMVTTMTFDETGNRLAAGGDDKTVRVWDLARVQSELSLLGLNN